MPTIIPYFSELAATDPETALIQKHLLERVYNAVEYTTNDREKYVLMCRLGYGDPEDNNGMTFAEIGKRMQLSVERTRQIYLHAIAKIRAALLEEEAERFLLTYDEACGFFQAQMRTIMRTELRAREEHKALVGLVRVFCEDSDTTVSTKDFADYARAQLNPGPEERLLLLNRYHKQHWSGQVNLTLQGHIRRLDQLLHEILWANRKARHAIRQRMPAMS